MSSPEIRPEERLLAALLRNPGSAPEVSILASHVWFLSPALATAFDVALSYACERGASPTREALLELMGRRSPGDAASHPDALARAYSVPAEPDEAKHLPYYCELVERDWKARTAKAVMLAAADMLDRGDVDGAVGSLQKDIAIPLTRFTSSELGSDFGSFWSEYERIERDPSLRHGVPMGFRTIDEATKGHFPKEMMVMVGGSGVGKSLFLGQVAVNAALAGKRVMLVTIENSREAYMRRLYSNICGVNYQDLKTASLTDADRARLFEGIAGLAEGFCLEVVHMDPPCCSRDILNIMRSSKRAYDYLVVDQITNMSPNHPKEFRIMDWRWYSQVALELRVLSHMIYGGKGVPCLTAVHAAGGTTDKAALTTDDTALAKSIGYHADGMLYITKKDAEYLLGKSKLRDAHFEPFNVYPIWSNWRLLEEPPRDGFGQTVDEHREALAPARAPDALSFDVEQLQREIDAQHARDDLTAAQGQTVPDDFVPRPPDPPAPPKEETTIDPEDL